VSGMTIPSLSVADIKVNIDYLVNALGFRLSYLAADGSQAVLEYDGAVLTLEAKTENESPAGPGKFAALQIRVGDIDGIYRRALTRGAIICRYIEGPACKDGGDRRFTVSLPEGYPLTFIG
jgi:catechol 2,3-dioxygenase-like lactoylglutathione lyase family enzyme